MFSDSVWFEPLTRFGIYFDLVLFYRAIVWDFGMTRFCVIPCFGLKQDVVWILAELWMDIGFDFFFGNRL